MPTPSKEVVLDIETQNTFEEVGGWFHDRLRISLVGVYFYETNEYTYYLEPDLPKLWPRLERAERIIGYNQKSFDNPVMNNYYPGDLNRLPQLDLLEEIHRSLGYRVKLDDVAQATIGMGKTGHGLQAVEFWKEGKIKELADYCLQDVRVTKEVYEFAKANGLVKFQDRMGAVHEVPLNIEGVPVQTMSAINLTMPF
ncbi:MAG: ribonuclease H-like domain-containing protein [Patescibacteria group bacterium]